MNNEKTLDGALYADGLAADAAQAAPAAGKKKYVSPTMQVIPLGPQRMLATSGGLPYEEGCFYDGHDGIDVPQETADAITAALDPATLQSNPGLLVSALEQSPYKWALDTGIYTKDSRNLTTLRGLLNSAVFTSASTEVDYEPFTWSNGVTAGELEFAFFLCGYIPDEYEFCVGGIFEDFGGGRTHPQRPQCVIDMGV